MMRPALLAVLATACNDSPDPCADVIGSCIELAVTSSEVTRIDQLELDVVFGDRHGTTTTSAGDGPVDLPLVTAIELDTSAGELGVGVVAAGKLGGTVLGVGAANTTVAAGGDARIRIELVPPRECVTGGHYCGGDVVAGDPMTLYQCNNGGVPLARGVCSSGCIVRPGDDDTCRGGGGVCVDGGHYCGGDKLDGDPQTLYRCAGGIGVDGVVCTDGCIVSPPGSDDRCR